MSGHRNNRTSNEHLDCSHFIGPVNHSMTAGSSPLRNIKKVTMKTTNAHAFRYSAKADIGPVTIHDLSALAIDRCSRCQSSSVSGGVFRYEWRSSSAIYSLPRIWSHSHKIICLGVHWSFLAMNRRSKNVAKSTANNANTVSKSSRPHSEYLPIRKDLHY